MTVALTELHDELRAVARGLLSRPASTVEGDASDRPASADWAALADAGWPGLEVSDALGGAGATLAEVLVAAEELGRVAARSPYLGTVVLGVGALQLVEPSPQVEALLTRVAAGAATVGVVLGLGPVGSPMAFRLERAGDGPRLAGSAPAVLDAGGADRLLVIADDGAGTGPVVVVVAPDAPGAVVQPAPAVDATRDLADVTVDTAVHEAAVARFSGDPARAVQRLLDRGALAVAADSLGLAEAMLAATVDYAGQRVQFGRPIGSFQAVKHACADMLVATTVGRELLVTAVDAHLADAPDASRLTSMAKARLGDVGVEVAGAALQLHGGIGYTWESGIHRYLKRAVLNRALFGSSRWHRRRVAQAWR